MCSKGWTGQAGWSPSGVDLNPPMPNKDRKLNFPCGPFLKIPNNAMDTIDAADCAPDDTQCLLLKKILAKLDDIRTQNDSYDWDPLTFGTTVFIGILAASLAFLTIFQAVTTAGPGRLKSSRTVIGPWSKLTKRKFDWQEMRFQSLAYTPFISFGSFIAARNKGGTFDPGVDQTAVDTAHRRSDYVPAGWLGLLARLHLDRTALWTTRTISADHLPPDLPATPAYGDARLIFSLAAILSEGKCTLRTVPNVESSFPVVHGAGVQLRVRNHPGLGSVAVFENTSSSPEFYSSVAQPRADYDREREFFLARSSATAICYSQGFMRISERKWINSLKFINKGHMGFDVLQIPADETSDTNTLDAPIRNMLMNLQQCHQGSNNNPLPPWPEHCTQGLERRGRIDSYRTDPESHDNFLCIICALPPPHA